MSFLKKEISKRIDSFITNRFEGTVIFKQQEMLEIKKKNDYYENQLQLPDLLKELATPAPVTGDLTSMTSPDPSIRFPRIPYNEFVYYLMRWNSSILRMICKVVKQEIFRETRLKGFEWEAKFKVKCSECGTEHEGEAEECEFCNSTELVPPNPTQKKLLEPFIKEANKAEQTLMEMYEEIEDDLNTVDDGYMIILKDYLSGPGGIFGQVKEFMRGDPSRFRIISDLAGRRGGLWWVCPNHRNKAFERGDYEEKKAICEDCGLPLLEVHYVETEAGGMTPVKFYIKGEVVHASKYEPSRLYGIPPVFSVYIITRTIQLMDVYTEELYEKGRLKGILAVPTENQKQLKKWLDEVLTRLRTDPHYLPFVGLPVGPEKSSGKIEYVKLIDSMEELQYQEHRRMLKEEIAGVYGVSLVFLSDPSAGTGLTNEGLQITVTDRAVEWGQAIYHDQYFPKLLEAIGITDWIIKLKPSREMDEMAELMRFDQRVTTAQKLQQMGYEMELKDEKFEVRGEAHIIANPSEQTGGYGDYDEQNSGQRLLPQQAGKPQLPAPQNREGVKNCPPGQIATPQNPKCHPIEWETKKALEGILRKDIEKGLIPISIIKKICHWLPFTKAEEKVDPECLARKLPKIAAKNQDWSKQKVLAEAIRSCQMKKSDVVQEDDPWPPGTTPEMIAEIEGHMAEVVPKQTIEIDIPEWDSEKATTSIETNILDIRKRRTELKKFGDSMAHIICVKRKMMKADIPEPEPTAKEKSDFFKFWAEWEFKMMKENPLFKKICDTCNKASSKDAKSDADWLDPYNYPYEDDEWKSTPLFPNEIGKGYGPDPSPGSIAAGQRLKIFDMERQNDESGISGTGLVASGIVFPDGKVSIRWNTETSSTTEFDTFEDFLDIHVRPHGGNHTKIHFYKLKEGDVKEFKKAIEAGKKVSKEVQKIESHFAQQLLKIFKKQLRTRLKTLDDDSPALVMKEIDAIVSESQPHIEKLAFSEVLRAYKKGKAIDEVKKDIPLPKNIDEPFQATYGAFGIDKADWQALRAIYRKNPFWNAFTGMSQSISDKLKEHITESYEAPSSARMKATIRDVEREYPGINKARAESIAYGRIGKFSLARTISMMKRTVNTEIYRLERIARTETTGITALGREMAFKERDPKNLFKYDWFGPQDHRTSEICTWIKKEVAGRGKGKGVSLEVLEEIMMEGNEKFLAKSWDYRKYVPHANCRHVLRRVV